MPGSYKTRVIQDLFRARTRDSNGRILNPIVTLTEVQEAIRAHNRRTREHRNTGNPANFFKDVKRSYDGFNAFWPGQVLRAGYTSVQRTGGGRCFEFIPLPAGQTQAVVPLYGPFDRNE